MSDREFDYKGYRVSIDVREAGNESATGVFLSTISFRSLHAQGDGGEWTRWERGSANIHFDGLAAYDAAVTRVKAHIDRLARP